MTTVHIVEKPYFWEDEENFWGARYPERNWSVIAPTKEEALSLLVAEESRRESDVTYQEETYALLCASTDPHVTVEEL